MFELWVRLIENSAVMSVAVLVLLGLTRLTRGKATARVRLGCWMLVAVGLLLPVRPVLWTVEMPEVVPGFSGFVGFSGVAISDVVVDDTWAVGLDGVMAVEGIYTDKWVASEGVFSGSGGVYYMPLVQNAASFDVNWRVMLPVVWAVGVLLFLSVCVVRHFWFVRKIRRWAKPTTETDVYEILTDVCRRVGLKQLPKLMVCPLTISPVMLGLFRPAIILPDATEPPERLRLILLHEVIHIKRKDNALRLLSLLATAAHWFNPLVYFMHRAVHQEIELACDAAVLRHAGDEARMAYGLTLMNAARRVQVVPVLASAMSGEGRNLKRRLADIIEKKHTRRGLALFCAFLMIGGVLLAGMLTYERREEIPEDGFVEDIGWQGDGVTLTDEEGNGEAADASTAYGDDDTDATATAPIHLAHTDQLIIYFPGGRDLIFTHSRFIAAAQAFRARYPDIELIIEHIGGADDNAGEAYIQRVSNELMAGLGPDLILTHFFDDIHKTLDAGLFMNLSPLWHRDPYFEHREQLHPAVMDAGVHRGRRYVMPLSFNFPLLVGEQGVLEKTGFDMESTSDILSFLHAMMEVPTAYNPLNRQISIDGNPRPLLPGIPFVDFERQEVLPDEAAFRAFAEIYQPFRQREQHVLDDMIMYAVQRRAYYLAQGYYLFIMHDFMALQSFSQYRLLLIHGYTPIITALRDHNGELHATVQQSVAISANSPNYANAWKFIRLLLTEEIQYGTVGQGASWGLGGGMPVNRAALSRQIMAGPFLGTGAGGFNFDWDGTLHQLPDINPAQREHITQSVADLINGITVAHLPNRVVFGFYEEVMAPFFDGQTDLDAAVMELERRLRLYLSE